MRLFQPGKADMARRNKVEAEETRQKILTAALDLFVAKSYERTTFEDVARRIRLSRGAVYWHFKSKPDLLTELIVQMSAMNVAQVSRMLPAPVSLDGLTAHFVERARLIAVKPAYRKFFRLMMSLDWPTAKFAPVKCRIRGMESDFFAVIKKTLSVLQEKGEVRSDADVVNVSAVLGAVWLGLMKFQFDQCMEMDLSRAVGLGFSAVIDAIRA
jgi:TetR/AcrR family acrAB operon transcriptional repressor